MPFISVIIPVYNEEEVLKELHLRLTKVLDTLGEEFEVILINDGSSDTSLRLIREIHDSDKRFKAISFSRNFGHQKAITAGLMYAEGDIVVILDADLQDPPEAIPQFIDKWREGHEVVYVIRKKRKEFIFKRMSYFVFYRVMKYLADINIPLDSGDFCLMDRKVVDLINSFPERNRFVRGLRSWIGYKQIGLEVERDRRFAGKPKYGLIKLLKLAFDGIFSFSEFPLKISTISGFLISGMSLLFSLFVVGSFMFGVNPYFVSSKPGWASLIVSITFLGGIQLIAIGILGEYLGRVFGEIKHRPLFIVEQLIGVEDNPKDEKSPVKRNHPGV